MNIEEWINSGIIESFVLGEATEAEAREVEEMAARHPEVETEIAETEIALEGLARKAAIMPRTGLKEDLFASLEKDNPGVVPMTEIRQPVAGQTGQKQAEVINMQAKTRQWQWLSAAAVALLILSSVLAIYYRGQWQATESQLANYIAEEQALSQQYQALRSDFNQLENQQQEVYTNPDFQQVRLQGTEVSPTAYAVVYWNDESDQVYLSPAGLPEPSSGKQYQLWGIVDGQPTSAGVFDLDSELMAMQQLDGASAFAITLEPEGGSESPTLEAMYVLGEV